MERERVVYDEASTNEENAFIEIGITLMEYKDPPPGWTMHEIPGRPRKKHVCHPIEFPWKGMVMVLLLKTYLGFDYRKMAARFNASPDLGVKIKFEKASSKIMFQRCIVLFT
jgi:hypothetical protein